MLLFHPLLPLPPLTPLSVPAPRLSVFHGPNSFIPSTFSQFGVSAPPTADQSLLSSLQPSVFLEMPFYLGFFPWFTLFFLLYAHVHLPYPLFHPFSLFASLSLSHSSSDPPPPTASAHSQVWDKDLLCPRKSTFQWGFGNVNTTASTASETRFVPKKTKNVTGRVQGTSPSAWVRDLPQGGECKVDD